MKNIYFVYAKRTPIGRFAGQLAPLRVDDMLAKLLEDFKSWANFDLCEVDDVIVGCANQAGEDNRNLARMSTLLAGLPVEVPATTINRLCGSSLDAALGAAARLELGLANCIVVAGAESMSRAPYVLSKAPTAYFRGQQLFDTALGWRFPNPRMKKLFPLYSMGETAEEVATLYKIPRKRQDQFALNSHQKALQARQKGLFKEEILPLSISEKKRTYAVDYDEGPRADTTADKLAQLKPVFRPPPVGTVTPGNSSSINDGASALAMVTEEFLLRHQLTPLARFTGGGIRGVHPNTMGLGPIAATEDLCRRYQKKISDFDVIELNEAFAAQSLACIDELKLDESKINLNGGAIALGHPLGCSGARITTTLIHIMKKNPSYRQGLATMCIGVGQGIAMSLENC